MGEADWVAAGTLDCMISTVTVAGTFESLAAIPAATPAETAFWM